MSAPSPAGCGITREELLGRRTDKERAAEYLRRRRPVRPVAPPQEEGLFDELPHSARQFVPLGQPEDALELFAKPQAADRKLIDVTGWPDFRAGDDG